MNISPWQRVLLIGSGGTLAVVMALHFFMTYLTLSPFNPLKATVWPAVQAYTRDLFAQNWSLFAPNPLHSNSDLLVQCKLDSELTSDWYNLSETMIQGLHANPVGPHVRLVRLHLTASRTYFGTGDIESEAIRETVCSHETDSDYCRREDEDSIRSREVGEQMLIGLGSATCAQMEGADRVKELRFTIVQRTVRPWSQQDNPNWEPTVASTQTPWLPYRAVAHLNGRYATAGERP